MAAARSMARFSHASRNYEASLAPQINRYTDYIREPEYPAPEVIPLFPGLVNNLAVKRQIETFALDIRRNAQADRPIDKLQYDERDDHIIDEDD